MATRYVFQVFLGVLTAPRDAPFFHWHYVVLLLHHGGFQILSGRFTQGLPLSFKVFDGMMATVVSRPITVILVSFGDIK